MRTQWSRPCGTSRPPAPEDTAVPPNVISLIFATGVAMLSLGATYWPAALGTLAASPGVMVILVAVLLAPLRRPRHLPIFEQLKLKRLLWVPVVGSAVSLAFFGLNPAYAPKFFSVGLLSLIWLSPLLLADYLNMHHLRRAVIVGICICLFAYVFSDLLQMLPPDLHNVVFGTEFQEAKGDRPRGFAEEPSQFAATFSRLIILYFLIRESRRRYDAKRLIGFLAALAVLLVALGSKGAVVGIAIAMLSFTMSRRQLPYLILALPAVWWLGLTQMEALANDIEQFSSTATRVTLMLTGVVATLANPLGWGYYGFYGAIQTFGGWALAWISDRFPVLLVFEARDIIEDLNNVSTKSTPLDFMMTFGWLFVWLMVRIVQLIRFNDPRVRACWVYVVISSLSTSGHLSILTFLIFAILLRLYPRTGDASARPFTSLRPAAAA